LLAKKYKVYSIEIDPFLCSVLKETFVNRDDFHLWEGDALKYLAEEESQLQARIESESYIFAGNLPYYITTDLLISMARKKHWKEGVFLVQKEYAERVTKPGAESSIAVYLNNFAEWKYSHSVPPGVFFPVPSVDSAVLYAIPRPNQANPEILEKLLRFSYRGKRKKIVNSWKNCGMPDSDLALLKEGSEYLGLSLDKRPEEWSPGDYYRLADFLEKSGTFSSKDPGRTSNTPPK
jgi:16S rRNA (adenine1518-N6/adenine1519-N6)-dimethyltransferase